MKEEQIFSEIKDIFIEVFDDQHLDITREATSNDIEDWDSLNHIQLVVAIEKHFKQRFTIFEIESWRNVGEMCDSIEKKINS